MIIRDLLKSPALKRALATGEEQMGRVVGQLLANERVMHGVQTVVASALNARSTLESGVRTAMQAVSLPTTEEVEELRQRLAELEAMLDGLAARVAPPSGAPEDHGPGGEGRGGEGR